MRVTSGASSMRSRGSSRKPSSLSRSTTPTLKAIGEALDWRLGAAWEVDPQDGCLRCVRTWHAGERAQRVRGAERGARRSRPARGCPAACWPAESRRGSSTRPQDANFPRAQAARRSGLHAGFGFPLRSPRGVVGVMEFFAGELREPDERLLAHDGRARQPGRPVRRRPPRRGGGARARVAAAGHARGGPRRGGDDGRRRARHRVEPRRRGDLRLHRERGRRARDGRAHRPAAPARRPPPRAGALPARPSTAWSSTAGWS